MDVHHMGSIFGHRNVEEAWADPKHEPEWDGEHLPHLLLRPCHMKHMFLHSRQTKLWDNSWQSHASRVEEECRHEEFCTKEAANEDCHLFVSTIAHMPTEEQIAEEETL